MPGDPPPRMGDLSAYVRAKKFTGPCTGCPSTIPAALAASRRRAGRWRARAGRHDCARARPARRSTAICAAERRLLSGPGPEGVQLHARYMRNGPARVLGPLTAQNRPCGSLDRRPWPAAPPVPMLGYFGRPWALEIERHAVALVERDLDHSIFHDCLAPPLNLWSRGTASLPSTLLSLIALDSAGYEAGEDLFYLGTRHVLAPLSHVLVLGVHNFWNCQCHLVINKSVR